MVTSVFEDNRTLCGSTSGDMARWSGEIASRPATACVTPTCIFLRFGDPIATVNDTRADFIGDQSTVVIVSSLGRSDYTLKRPYPIVVQQLGSDNFIAHMFSRDLTVSGDSIKDAVDAMKDYVVTTFELLRSLRIDELGPIPRRQLRLLNSAIRTTKP